MTPRSPAPLAGTDAIIVSMLARIVAYGRHHKTFAAHDVVRVAVAHLPGGDVLRRKLRDAEERTQAAEERAETATVRADAAEQRAQAAEERAERLAQANNELTERIAAASHHRHIPHRVVWLTKRDAQLFGEVCKGRLQKDIAQELHVCRSTVAMAVQRARERMGARTPTQAIALVSSGEVEVVVRNGRRVA